MNSKKFYILLFTILSIGFLLCACSNNDNSNSSSPITFVDALGRAVEMDSPPQRIMIGGNGSIMIVDAIFAFPEANDLVIGYAKTDQGHGNFTQILDKNHSAAMINNKASIEETATLKPDLVLLKSYMKEMGDGLEQLGIPVAYMDFESLEQYKRDLTNLGIILENPSRAVELFQYYENIITNVTNATKNLEEELKPSVLFIYYSSRNDTISFNVPPLDWAQTTMIELAGGSPIWTDIPMESNWTRVNIEQIAAWNPDIIFLTAYFDDIDTIKNEIMSDTLWGSLQAVKNDQLYAIPMGFYSWDQPHTRWGVTQQWMAAKIQPDLFPNFSFDETSRHAYYFLYGLEADDYDSVILPKLQGDIGDTIQ